MSASSSFNAPPKGDIARLARPGRFLAPYRGRIADLRQALLRENGLYNFFYNP